MELILFEEAQAFLAREGDLSNCICILSSWLELGDTQPSREQCPWRFLMESRAFFVCSN
jgi:hypothetical protein